MAKKSNNSNNKNENKSNNTKKSSGSVWSLNKVSFYTIGAVAILYLLAIIFSAIGGALLTAVAALQAVASAVLICIVAVNAWRFVKGKQTVWKVLYFVFLLVLLAGIIVPTVLGLL